MDSKEMEQKFDAMYMAIVNGYVSAARCVFERSIQTAVEEKLDQVINYLEKENRPCSSIDIEKFRQT